MGAMGVVSHPRKIVQPEAIVCVLGGVYDISRRAGYP